MPFLSTGESRYYLYESALRSTPPSQSVGTLPTCSIPRLLDERGRPILHGTGESGSLRARCVDRLRDFLLQLIDFIIQTHPAYAKVQGLAKEQDSNVFDVLEAKLEELKKERGCDTSSTLRLGASWFVQSAELLVKQLS